MIHIDKDEFLANLRLTQAYCEQQLKQPVEQSVAALRSLNPDYGEGKLFRYVANEYPTNSGTLPELVVEWANDSDPYDNVFMTSVFEKQLTAKRNSLKSAVIECYKGEILVVEYDSDIPDGASAVESEGFVDTNDFPPIDTWFYKAHNGEHGWVLFTWVPEPFIRLANEAVAIHFLDIIQWFKYWMPIEYGRVMV